MKLKGISEKGISRIARSMKSQDLGEPDYGEGNPEGAKKALEESGAEWTPEGWAVEEDLYFWDLGLTRLPLVSSVGGSFYCNGNQLVSLNGSPKVVGGYFYCFENQLTSLEGAPREVEVDFFCHDNQLVSLEGAPEKVGEDFSCYGNSVEFTKEDVEAVCNVGGNIMESIDSIEDDESYYT